MAKSKHTKPVARKRSIKQAPNKRPPTPKESAEWRIANDHGQWGLSLDLQGAGLSELPNNVGRLVEHEEMDFSRNMLSSLPDSIISLKKLRRLYLNGNRFKTVPDCVALLDQLEVLDLSENELTELPKFVEQLPNLSTLYLHGNNALRLPTELLGATRSAVARSIELAIEDKKDNLRPINPAQAKDILAYYFQAKHGSRPLNEIKLIFVGRGGSGKSSIRDRLLHNTFDPQKRETEGVEIQSWTIECADQSIEIRTWDFAGQEITHATHQFFLTERSIYVLVLDARADTQDRDAEYWLRLINAFGKESPIIIALNKADEKPFAIDEQALRERFPSIKAFVNTDCKTRKGITELAQAINIAASESKGLHQVFPADWWRPKHRFTELAENYISFSQFRQICNKYGMNDVLEQEQFARILHALGIVLHYADDPRLRDTTVLNPRWVTNGVYKLLRLKEHPNSNGVLTFKDARDALSTEPSEMVMYLIGLMHRFELCYPLDEDHTMWLVPQLLSKFQPILGNEWKHPSATRIRYCYSVLPEGLVPRFIVRTHPLSNEQIRWRNGVVLSLEGASALIRAELAENTVYVVAIGDESTRLRLLKIIRGHFTDIHAQLEGLNPREEIEIKDHPGSFKSVQLLEADEIKAGVTTVETQDGSVIISQKEQLDRISDLEARKQQQPDVKLFVVYSRKDLHIFEIFRQHLEILKMDHVIRWWCERDIPFGADLEDDVRREIHDVDLIVLLVSTAFLASPYIRSHELAQAIARQKKKEVEIVSVILENDCAWDQKRVTHLPKVGKIQIDLSNFHTIFPAGKAVRGWARYGNAFGAVEETLRDLIAQIHLR